MPSYGRVTLIAAAMGATFLIPSGAALQVAVADVPPVSSFTSHKTIAAIDAMLSPPVPDAELQRRLRRTAAAPEPEPGNFQTVAVTRPEPIQAPTLDPSLKPDAIGRSAVNLRAGPSSSTSAIAVLSPGQAIHTGTKDGGWVEVTLSDGTTGWVFSRYLASVAETAPLKTAAAPKAEGPTKAKTSTKGNAGNDLDGRTAVIEASVDARSIPAKSARTIFRTSPGERVRIVDVRGKWLRIVTADGSSGWIKTS